MKKSISVILAICLLSSISHADCDFSTIVKNADGTRTYSKEQHVCVGQLVQDSATKDLQIKDLTGAITLKDVAIQKADERATLWMDTSLKLENNIQNIDKNVKTNEYLMFALGCLVTIGAGYGAAKLAGR